VRKCARHSKLEQHNVNPIKTSYELLWMELRNPGTANPWIENTLRRILEHYFTILGSIDRDGICAGFDGQDKQICKSLFSWVNAGSHSVHDDAYITPSDAATKNCLQVFKAIFEKTGHIAHFEMMMRDASTSPLPPRTSPAQTSPAPAPPPSPSPHLATD
ncbi:MAG: AAA family ATPase, partial [Planctomycetales bacterium]|nr:AAA family ATPase [Planctomycetales bacterium]